MSTPPRRSTALDTLDRVLTAIVKPQPRTKKTAHTVVRFKRA
jgi:hypothetical protein